MRTGKLKLESLASGEKMLKSEFKVASRSDDFDDVDFFLHLLSGQLKSIPLALFSEAFELPATA